MLAALRAFVRQRPGLDPRLYGGGVEGWRLYRSEAASVAADRRQALAMLAHLDLCWGNDIGPKLETVLGAFRAFSGRLSVVMGPKGCAIDYCTGQFFAIEYRAAVCAVLAQAYWDHMKESSPDLTGDQIRRNAQLAFGKTIARRWFQ